MRTAFVLVLAFVLASILGAQASLAPDNGGGGFDGAFNPLAPVTLNTAVQAVYQFTSFTIPNGVVVNVVGPNPIVIKVQGAVVIDGTLNASGSAGVVGGNNLPGGLGGAGGPGGGAGGAGGASVALPFVGTGSPGLGASPGQPGIDSGLVGGLYTDPVGGGGGGGNSTAGTMGALRNAGGASASGAGGAAVLVCRGGSGGGGGGGDLDSATVAAQNDGGGGGGGGGGDLILSSNVTITVNGSIFARGGVGGTSSGNGGGGGGGSGGAIDLVAPFIAVNGTVSATGGAAGLATQTNCGCSAGGVGGDGCIRLASSGVSGGGTVLPTPVIAGLELFLTPVAPGSTLAVSAQTATSNYIVVAGLSIVAVPIVLPAGTFYLDLADPLLNLLFPVNTLPFVFAGLTGAGSGVVSIDTSLLGLPPTFDLTIYAQGASLTPTLAIDGITPVVPVHIRY